MRLQKETDAAAKDSLHGRWYGDACGAAFAMELLGERWSLLIVRELLLGALRFSDLRAGLPGISAKVLTERLGTLEAAGILRRRRLPPPGAAQVYELTALGHAAEVPIMELGRWAAHSSRHDPTLPLSPVSLMMSLRTMIDPLAARNFDADIGFAVAGQEFRARLVDGKLPIDREAVEGAQAVFRAPAAPPVAAHFYGDVPVIDLPDLVLDGDDELAARFAALFSLPARLD